MRSLKPESGNDAATENPGQAIRAIMVEDPSTVRGMIAERADKLCNRCLDPEQVIAGIVFFMDAPNKVLAHLGRSDWALCSPCLISLKRRGAEALTQKREWGN